VNVLNALSVLTGGVLVLEPKCVKWQCASPLPYRWVNIRTRDELQDRAVVLWKVGVW